MLHKLNLKDFLWLCKSQQNILCSVMHMYSIKPRPNIKSPQMKSPINISLPHRHLLLEATLPFKRCNGWEDSITESYPFQDYILIKPFLLYGKHWPFCQSLHIKLDVWCIPVQHINSQSRFDVLWKSFRIHLAYQNIHSGSTCLKW